jgi:hypothetical protein
MQVPGIFNPRRRLSTIDQARPKSAILSSPLYKFRRCRDGSISSGFRTATMKRASGQIRNAVSNISGA